MLTIPHLIAIIFLLALTILGPRLGVPAMPRWRYMEAVVNSHNKVICKLRVLGLEGWELTSIITYIDDNNIYLFLKREIPEPPNNKWDPNGCETGV